MMIKPSYTQPPYNNGICRYFRFDDDDEYGDGDDCDDGERWFTIVSS